MTNGNDQTPQGESSSHNSSPNDSSYDSRFRLPAWAKAAILLAAIGFASIGYLKSLWLQAPAPTQVGEVGLDPDELAQRIPVPDFILTDGNGQQKKLSDFRGNVVILSFWASWCAPCLTELPTFAKLEEKFGEQGFKILAVNVDDGDDGKTFVAEFWKNKNIPFPSYFDTSKELAQQFEVDMLPSNFVIDRQGRMVFSSFGANDWMSSGSVEFIEGLLREGMTDPASNL